MLLVMLRRVFLSVYNFNDLCIKMLEGKTFLSGIPP